MNKKLIAFAVVILVAVVSYGAVRYENFQNVYTLIVDTDITAGDDITAGNNVVAGDTLIGAGLQIGDTALTSTAAELNLQDGATLTEYIPILLTVTAWTTQYSAATIGHKVPFGNIVGLIVDGDTSAGTHSWASRIYSNDNDDTGWFTTSFMLPNNFSEFTEFSYDILCSDTVNTDMTITLFGDSVDTPRDMIGGLTNSAWATKTFTPSLTGLPGNIMNLTIYAKMDSADYCYISNFYFTYKKAWQ